MGRMPCPLGVNCRASAEVASGTSPPRPTSIVRKHASGEGGMGEEA